MPGRVNTLELEGLVKVYETGHRVLDGLSLSVPAGSIFGFIGLNGAGKTTTIRIIAGLISKTAGSVRLFGREIDPRESDHQKVIGYVLDDPLYFDWMSPREYLEFVGTMYGLESGEAVRRTIELLDFFDLADKRDEPIWTFSTGMKKKVSLAAAIVHRPSLIVLDEPLEGIDALASSAMKETLAMMAAEGTTIFITSHVLDTVERFCTDVAIIHAGKIVLRCKTGEIRQLARGTLKNESYQSLEELFVEIVSDRVKRKHLSFLQTGLKA
jgi:ABC-2 type transport system ATP-binding protein